MHCETKISEGLYYVGGSDRRLHLFENVYPLENGASYNSYLYLDEKTLLLDTVDSAVSGVFYDNLAFFFHSGKKEHRFYQQHFWNCPFFQQLRYQVHHDRTFYIYSDQKRQRNY